MKVAGSYESLVRGVSQQQPHLRRAGQHGSIVNFVPDPIRGLARRRGTRWQAERLLPGVAASSFAACSEDAKGFRRFAYTADRKDYELAVRRQAKAPGSQLPFAFCYDVTGKAFLPVVRPTTDPMIDALEADGLSAITSVGRYVFMAGNSTVPTVTSVDRWGDTANQGRSVLWVRGGAYSRTFKATVTKTDNTQVSFSYQTPAAAYPGLLDTSGVSPIAPDLTGSSGGTGPTLADGSATVFGDIVAGGTFTLPHAGSVITNLSLYWYFAQHDSVDSGTLHEGLHFTISGGVLTWLVDVPLAAGSLSITYKYQTSPTGGATTVYATEQTTETLYIKAEAGKAAATLVWGKWEPAALSVNAGQRAMTNVHPSVTPAPGQYSWAPGAPVVIFHASAAGAENVSAVYTHIKTVANPNYQNQIADMTAAYQRAVTAWIASAASATQPQAIAEQLRLAAVAAGLTGATRVDSTVVLPGVKAMLVQDGGDGTLVRGVANEVPSIDQVSSVHFVGKVIKVRPANSPEVLYLEARPKIAGATGYTDVTWVEAAGTVCTVSGLVAYGIVSGGSFYVAGSASKLAEILPGTHPDYSASVVGDTDTSPIPYFAGRRIDYLGVFQDRLLVGSGAVIRASRTGDYLNFFRKSVLTVPADDTLEVLSQGSEDDTILAGVLYDKDLILIGQRRQYVMSGRVPLSPTNANMPVMSSHKGAADVQPVAAGGVIFYAQRGIDGSSVHQIEPGRNAESPEAYTISAELSSLLPADASEILYVPKPSTLMLRAASTPPALFVFSYLDVQGGERIQAAWHKWHYSTGPLLTAGVFSDGVLLFSLRSNLLADATGSAVWVVADWQPLTADTDTYPYLDSQRPWSSVTAGASTRQVHATLLGPLNAAFARTSDWGLVGGSLLEAPALVAQYPAATNLTVGYSFDTEFEPTNPFMRDRNDNAILSGRLTVTNLGVSFAESTGFISTVTGRETTREEKFNGRLIGAVDNLLGREPVTTGRVTRVVGMETRDYSIKFKARDWFPLTLTGLDWTGQFFNRTQRI